jgi:hypothetical protein
MVQVVNACIPLPYGVRAEKKRQHRRSGKPTATGNQHRGAGKRNASGNQHRG